jgi:NAD-dependent deacetylase
MDSKLEDPVEQARALVAASRRIVVLTGAGISTESGIPDFRGPQGVWTKDPSAEKRATLDAYVSDPELRKRAWQRRLTSEAFGAQPNAGHRALLALERTGKLQLLITQNIDGLHQRAGSSPERIVEIHGTIHEVVCLECGDRAPMERALERVRGGELDPACRSCGGILKSATISFGQSLVYEDLMRSERAARSCDLLIAVGSTLSVYPVAGVVPLAKRAGAKLVIVNGETTAMDELADVVLRGRIGELLPRIVDQGGAQTLPNGN